MAAPITHIVLTDLVFKQHFATKDKKKFFIGTSFPDIRYLGVIKRQATHFSNPNLTNIQKETDSFIAGLKFHSLLDETRESYMVSNHIYEQLPQTKEMVSILKVLEERLLYSKLDSTQWQTYYSYFEDIVPEELQFSIDSKDIQTWHSALKLLFKNKPDLAGIKKFTEIMDYHDHSGDTLHSDIIQGIINTIDTLENNSKVTKIIHGLYNDFPKLILKPYD